MVIQEISKTASNFTASIIVFVSFSSKNGLNVVKKIYLAREETCKILGLIFRAEIFNMTNFACKKILNVIMMIWRHTTDLYQVYTTV